MTLTANQVGFREPPEGKVTITDFARCEDVAKELDGAKDKVMAALKDGTRIAAGPDFIALGARRTGPGQVEVHEKETDTIYVIDGGATFVTGGKMIGGKVSRPNQWLGTSIEGGQTHHLKKGDFISVPAGVPHWFKEVPTSINYYVVKSVKP
jgi:mannose-6-phosphate isomerase-like protein (cupin superfamily)